MDRRWTESAFAGGSPGFTHAASDSNAMSKNEQNLHTGVGYRLFQQPKSGPEAWMIAS
jgi:hypothetical protein